MLLLFLIGCAFPPQPATPVTASYVIGGGGARQECPDGKKDSFPSQSAAHLCRVEYKIVSLQLHQSGFTYGLPLLLLLHIMV